MLPALLGVAGGFVGTGTTVLPPSLPEMGMWGSSRLSCLSYSLSRAGSRCKASRGVTPSSSSMSYLPTPCPWKPWARCQSVREAARNRGTEGVVLPSCSSWVQFPLPTSLWKQDLLRSPKGLCPKFPLCLRCPSFFFCFSRERFLYWSFALPLSKYHFKILRWDASRALN